MMHTRRDMFTAVELYLLAAAFGGDVLFGLPEKEVFQLKGEEVFAEAHKQLIEKGILTSDGKITDAGAFIIRAIEFYHQSEKYVRINNLMFAFQEKDADELIVLVELEEKEAYQVFIVSKSLVLGMLGEKFPVVLREPEANEGDFLKEALSNWERREVENFEPESMFMNLEIFQLDAKVKGIDNPAYYQQWLIFTKEEKLIMVDPVSSRYFHASQYWFMKVLFDAMEFPYKGGN